MGAPLHGGIKPDSGAHNQAGTKLMRSQLGAIFHQNFGKGLRMDCIRDATGNSDGKGGFVLRNSIHGRDRPFHNKFARLWRRVRVNL